MFSISGFGGISSQPLALFLSAYLLPCTEFSVMQADNKVTNNRVITGSLHIAIQTVVLFTG
ncbi:hypothetical protein [Salinisphaera sp. G21_0]|uniref:hypothetical protein n=1 Tax=Salinisphaera sp. G21_0 TaxID=2821094 RepID=UPI001ADBC7D3|nr:hypothetical protein [Salinisphaera sp. G21_0]MBO9482866.1 hypothetical protein [Salinisphaera sp. G21_0]